MSAIEQFTYTASPWGKSDPGWMTFQKSPGIEDTDIGKLSSYYRYGRPDGWDGAPGPDSLSSYPVQFVFARPDVFGGDALLVQTTFTGKRWYDPRPGDWFVHGFRIAPSVVTTWKNSTESLLRLFKSDSIQREYPQELREKATLISQKKMQWEAPPDLPSLDSLDSLVPNDVFDFEALLERIPDGAWPKLGGLLVAAVKRSNTAKAFVFDATRPESLDTMAALLALMPVKSRMESQFSTYFHAENVREIKADDTFLFYGTVREDESADPDTGLYGDLPQGGPDFQCREDVELFKRMVDDGGAELAADDFDNLVLCWEVASGRKTEVASLREAVKFAERFKELKQEVAKGFTNALSNCSGELSKEPLLASIVAEHELGIISSDNPGELSAFIHDNALFAEALKTLGDDASRKSFADAVAKQAETSGTIAKLAEMWLGCGQDVRALLMRNVTGPFVSITALADRYDAIRRDVEAGSVEPGQAAALLAEADKAAEKFGDDFNGMELTRNSLRYLAALDALKDVDGLSDFERAIRSLGIDEATIRNDVLERVNPGDIPAERLAETMAAFEVIGMTRADVLQEAIKAAKEQGYKSGCEEGKRSGRQLAHEAEARTCDAEAHRGLPVWLVIVIAVTTLVVGLAGGWFLHATYGAERPSGDASPEARFRTRHIKADWSHNHREEGDFHTGTVGTSSFGPEDSETTGNLPFATPLTGAPEEGFTSSERAMSRGDDDSSRSSSPSPMGHTPLGGEQDMRESNGSDGSARSTPPAPSGPSPLGDGLEIGEGASPPTPLGEGQDMVQ